MSNIEITHNVFEMMTAITNDFITRAYVVPPVNSYMVKKVNDNEYIVFVLKEFDVFKVKFGETYFTIIMKDGVSVQMDIIETDEMFSLHQPDEPNTVVFVPDKETLEAFLKAVRSLCRIEKRSYIPTVKESKRVLGYNVTRKNII